MRLIGRLSVLETLVIYIPAIAINIVSIYLFEKGDQAYYLNIDSLILVGYACCLMGVVLGQKERLLSSWSYFRFYELFKADVDDYDEQEMEFDKTPADLDFAAMVSPKFDGFDESKYIRLYVLTMLCCVCLS